MFLFNISHIYFLQAFEGHCLHFQVHQYRFIAEIILSQCYSKYKTNQMTIEQKLFTMKINCQNPHQSS